jgi:DNA polymerase-3 subunit epsilon
MTPQAIATRRRPALLGTHPDYRVQRRLGPVTHFHAASPEASSRIGVAIDVETTGLDRETDRIIELAIQRSGSMNADTSSRLGCPGSGLKIPVCRSIRKSPA